MTEKYNIVNKEEIKKINIELEIPVSVVEWLKKNGFKLDKRFVSKALKYYFDNLYYGQ